MKSVDKFDRESPVRLVEGRLPVAVDDALIEAVREAGLAAAPRDVQAVAGAVSVAGVVDVPGVAQDATLERVLGALAELVEYAARPLPVMPAPIVTVPAPVVQVSPAAVVVPEFKLDDETLKALRRKPTVMGQPAVREVQIRDHNSDVISPATEETLASLMRGSSDSRIRFDYDGRTDSNPVYVARFAPGETTGIVEKWFYDGNTPARPTDRQALTGTWADRASLDWE